MNDSEIKSHLLNDFLEARKDLVKFVDYLRPAEKLTLSGISNGEDFTFEFSDPLIIALKDSVLTDYEEGLKRYDGIIKFLEESVQDQNMTVDDIFLKFIQDGTVTIPSNIMN